MLAFVGLAIGVSVLRILSGSSVATHSGSNPLGLLGLQRFGFRGRERKFRRRDMQREFVSSNGSASARWPPKSFDLQHI